MQKKDFSDYHIWNGNVYNLSSTIHIPMTSHDTQTDIIRLLDNLKEFLLEKNRRYGDSAIDPVLIFSNVSAGDQIKNRLDDKLSRIKHSDKLRKNDVADVMGYAVLLMVQNGWLEFDELLD